MEVFILYIIFCMIVGWISSGTTLGFWSGFLFSIILTPIIGFIITLFYPSRAHRDQQDALLRQALQQKQQPEVKATPISLSDELLKLETLKEKKLVSDDEYRLMRDKLMKHHL